MTAPDPRIEAVDRVLRAYGLQGDVGKKMRQDILAAVLPELETGAAGMTLAEWDEWSNEVAASLPEDWDDDVAQEEVIRTSVLRLVEFWNEHHPEPDTLGWALLRVDDHTLRETLYAVRVRSDSYGPIPDTYRVVRVVAT